MQFCWEEIIEISRLNVGSNNKREAEGFEFIIVTNIESTNFDNLRSSKISVDYRYCT